jgi:hypothetical protein
MNVDEQLVREVVNAARLVSAPRRAAVACELRGHLQDIRDQALADGVDPVKLDDTVRERFGPPLEIGRQLSKIYRAERARYLALTGAASAAILTIVAAATVYGFQRWLSFRMGYSPTLSGRHFSRELTVIGVAIACYIALRFVRHETKDSPIWATFARSALIIAGIVGVSLSAFDPGRSAALGGVFAVVLDRLSDNGITNAWKAMLAVVASLLIALLPWGLTTSCGPRGMLFMLPAWFAIALAVCFSAFAANLVESRIVSKRFTG